MLGTYFTFPELLIWIPLIGGLLTFFLKNNSAVKGWTMFISLAVVLVSGWSFCYVGSPESHNYYSVAYYWLRYIGSNFSLRLDEVGLLMSALTALGFLFIFLYDLKSERQRSSSFYGLMLLAQAGIMGVFSANDALVFYFFWELALIPVYFLCSMWGGENRIRITFKFFVYTFLGSLLMLTGILFIYYHTNARELYPNAIAEHSFSWRAFQAALLTPGEQCGVFLLFLAAFGVKMPIFPLHTWQPDTYDQSPTSVTMVLSGLMVKMGLFGVIRWLLPIMPEASQQYANIVIILCLIGIIYGSLLAIQQSNVKKLIAYSSIAHIGLMSAALFTFNSVGTQGAIIQMFHHGINIIGWWIIVGIIERQTGSKSMNDLSGVATKAPSLAIFAVIIGMANIALPLTNAFIGEFMMFSGLFQYNNWMAAIALVGIILAAIYTLNMIRKVFYGEVSPTVANMTDIKLHEKLALSLIVVIIFVLGVYSQPLLDLISNASILSVSR